LADKDYQTLKNQFEDITKKAADDVAKGGINFGRNTKIAASVFDCDGGKFFTDRAVEEILEMDVIGRTVVTKSEKAKLGVKYSAKAGKWVAVKAVGSAVVKTLPVVGGVLEGVDRLDNGKDLGEASRGALIVTLALIAGSAVGGAAKRKKK